MSATTKGRSEHGFSPLCCLVWSGVLFGGLTVGGMLIRWGLELMS